jgi:hypothetical protein
MNTPYAGATAGTRAREETQKILRRLGCEQVGFMDDHVKHELLLAFTYRNRNYHFKASAKGWASMYLRENPYSHRMRKSRTEHEQEALHKGQIAVNSVIRDWVKGQVTAIESGVLSFEHAFMPWALTADGRPLIERLAETNLLPPPAEPKVVQLTSGAA